MSFPDINDLLFCVCLNKSPRPIFMKMKIFVLINWSDLKIKGIVSTNVQKRHIMEYQSY